MRIGILTYHRSHNYGAFLQAYSLVFRLKREFPDEQIELIDYNMLVAEKFYKKRIISENHGRTIIYNYRRYRILEKCKNFLPVSEEKLVSDDISDFQKFVNCKYDLIVAGSDEIWRIPGFRGFPNAYWLPGELGCLKISYAVSSRIKAISVEDEKKIAGYLTEFSYIGVRDRATKKVLGNYTSKRINYNCDPSFIGGVTGNPEKGKKLLQNKFKVISDKKVLGLMLDVPEDAKRIKKLLGENYTYISLYRKLPGTKAYPELTPFEWVDVISALDFLLRHIFMECVFR